MVPDLFCALLRETVSMVSPIPTRTTEIIRLFPFITILSLRRDGVQPSHIYTSKPVRYVLIFVPPVPIPIPFFETLNTIVIQF